MYMILKPDSGGYIGERPIQERFFPYFTTSKHEVHLALHNPGCQVYKLSTLLQVTEMDVNYIEKVDGR